ncbi:uncharacterized protein ARMOST_15046 [Armillaria ostoyae]|uniref:Uncharacterized protein n=1 Tax=Armillaria ostoyae TaxID=47428 RepID=A0A284RSB2_ARMOS|nr:uncharacterized protein ARMOST_15046 [Armillaria ostoyae]
MGGWSMVAVLSVASPGCSRGGKHCTIIYHTPGLCSRSSRSPVIVITVLAVVVAVVAGFVLQVPSRCEMRSDLESPAISQVIDTPG